MIYCDTSLLIAFLTIGASTHAVQSWIERHAGALAVSEWVHTEFASAIAQKQRMKAVSAEIAVGALHRWSRADAALELAPVGRRHFEQAARLIGRAALSLRAANALHAAIASYAGHILATLDRGELGIAAIDPLA